MDFAKECGFKNDDAAKKLMDKAIDLYSEMERGAVRDTEDKGPGRPATSDDIAKINRGEEVTEEEAIEEKESPAPESSGNENKVLETIKKLDEGDGIYYDDLGIAVSLEGIDGPMLDEILDSLTDQGLIFQPRFNHYKEA